MVDPADPEIQGWLRASRSRHVEFLNSLAAMYLTEAKRVLALLSDPAWRQTLGLDDDISGAIDQLIPFTRILPHPDGQDAQEVQFLGLLEHHRHHLVLKPDALTRGQGVYIGGKLSREQWLSALRETAGNHGVVQLCINTPRRENFSLRPGGLERSTDFYGVDLFYFDGDFGGPFGRSHDDMVFNVGNGGKVCPILVIR
jgi:hypothetical protein